MGNRPVTGMVHLVEQTLNLITERRGYSHGIPAVIALVGVSFQARHLGFLWSSQVGKIDKYFSLLGA